jgi:hypothetical protein
MPDLFNPNAPMAAQPAAASPVIPDFSAQQASLAQQKRLAEQLRKSATGQPQGEMVSGHYVAPHWSQHLAAGLQDFMATRAESDAGAQEGALNQAAAKERQRLIDTAPQAVPDQFLPGREGSLENPNQPTPGSTIEGTPLQTAQVLKHAMLMKQVPGGADIADMYQKGALADIAREDTQKANKEKQIADLQLKRDEAERRSQDIRRTEADRLEDKRQARAAEERMNALHWSTVRENAKDRAAAAGAAGPKETTAQSKERQDVEHEVTSTATTKSALDRIEQVLPNATGTKVGQGVDALGRMVNYTTKGAEAQKELDTLKGTLLAHTPKFSGPTSDRDVIVYNQAVGDLSNPDSTVAERQAALRQVRSMNDLALQQAHARATQYNKRAVGEDYKVTLPTLPKAVAAQTGGASGGWGGAAPAGAPATVGKPAAEGATQVIGGVKYTKRGGQWHAE